MITVLPSDNNLRYMGRIDFAAPDAPEFYWPGSLVQFRFTGSALSMLALSSKGSSCAQPMT